VNWLLILLIIVFINVSFTAFWHWKRGKDKRIIHVGRFCKINNCCCKQYHSYTIHQLNKMPPFHEGCDCYINE
jgi:hypothetical protein